MAAFEILSTISTIGIAAVFGAFIYIGRKLQTLDHLDKTTGKIKSNVKVISDYLTSANADFNHAELQTYSPLGLTPKGRKLIKTLGFDIVFQEHQDDFYDFISEEQPTLKYDVEKAAIKSITALYDKAYMNFLKVYFYNNPSRNVKNMSPTLGIYVRDKYLEKHPEIIE